MSEALANVALYAYADGPGPVDVVVQVTEDEIVVTVRDEGQGLGAPRPVDEHGYGLAIVRKLTERYDVMSSPGAGTELRMVLGRHAVEAGIGRSGAT